MTGAKVPAAETLDSRTLPAPAKPPTAQPSLPSKGNKKTTGKGKGSREKKNAREVGFQQQALNEKGVVEPGTTRKGPKNVHHCPSRKGKSHSVKAECIKNGHCISCDLHPGRYRHPKQPCAGCIAEEQARHRASSAASSSARSASTLSSGSGSETGSQPGPARSGPKGRGWRKGGK